VAIVCSANVGGGGGDHRVHTLQTVQADKRGTNKRMLLFGIHSG
jgi:hypothetical protein